MISTIELKKYMANASIFDFVVGKLRYEKKPYPIILLKSSQKLKGKLLLYYFAFWSDRPFVSGRR